MAQNVTTVLDKDVITKDGVLAEPLVENFLYLIHGSGSNRDRKMSLTELMAYMKTMDELLHLTDLLVHKGFVGGVKNVKVDGEYVKLYAEGTGVLGDDSNVELSRFHLSVKKTESQSGYEVEITPTGIEISKESGNVTVKTEIGFNKVKTADGYFKRIVGTDDDQGSNSTKLTIDSNLVINGQSWFNLKMVINNLLETYGLHVKGHSGDSYSAVFDVVATFNAAVEIAQGCVIEGTAIVHDLHTLNAVSEVDNSISDVYDISDSHFSDNFNRVKDSIRTLTGSGSNHDVYITAQVKNDRYIRVVNALNSTTAFVRVYPSGGGYPIVVLAPGASMWIKGNETSSKWDIADDIIG